MNRTLPLRARFLLLASALAVLLGCGESEDRLRAVVLDHLDSTTQAHGTTELLERAGFETVALDLDDPDLTGANLLVLGSMSSEHPGYADFVEKHTPMLRAFVDTGGVLLQMAQDAKVEWKPAFLPKSHVIMRRKEFGERYYILDSTSVLVRDLPRRSHAGVEEAHVPQYLDHWPVWSPIYKWGDYRQLLFSQKRHRYAGLLEGAYGEGRFLMTTLWVDKIRDGSGKRLATKEIMEFATAFFRNLNTYTRSVMDGTAPDPTPLPRPAPPEPAVFVPGSWTLVIFPDTQDYAARRPDVLHAQTQWIANNAERLDIRHVLHVGDVTENNRREEWQVVREAFDRIEGVVPYAITTGNHDHGKNGSAGNRTTFFSDYFPAASFREWPSFGGTFEAGAENSYHLFEAGGYEWIVLLLEWGPRDPVLDWANDVLREHADRRAIVVTHAYMLHDDTRQAQGGRGNPKHNPHGYGTARGEGGTNDGEQIWQKLVSRHGTVDFVFCGHMTGDGAARLTSQDDTGHPVHQILANYQHYKSAAGMLRLVEFRPDGKTVQVKTYSPYLDEYLTDWENQFVLELPSR
jgi:hypothetical protein